jgi:hypothetical protein
MKSRHLLFSGIFVLTLLCFTEVLLRIGLVFFGYSFFQPSDYIFTGFYDNLKKVQAKEIRRGGEVKNVLILGGSVVSTPWSHLESRLDTMLQKRYGEKVRYAFYNIAGAGHTSRDNALKYSLLSDQRFDLVIYYEAVNENRANNIPPADFRSDYTHMRWYRDIYLLQAHPEINFTVIPYLAHKLASRISDHLGHRIYISQENVDPQFARFGADIKTGASYRQNIEQIIQTAKSRGDKLLLMSYASYFPENVVLTGEQNDMKHFAGCNYASPVVIWGRPENVKKGIGVHNQMLRGLVRKHPVAFLDMENRMPKDSTLFCDVCHVSELGAQRFSHEIVEFIVRQKLLDY